MFEIQFIERETGATIRKQVPSHQIARQLARDLAVASGRRAIVRKCGAWSRARIVVLNLDQPVAIAVKAELERSQADRIVRDWDRERANSVAIAWPVGVPIPSWIERC
jgi:hypothetical protein